MKRIGDLAADDLLEGFHEPAILLGNDYLILAANQAYRQRFPCAAEPVGQTCYQVSHRYDRPCDSMGEACPLRESQASGSPSRLLHLHHTPKGRIHEQVSTYPIRNRAGKIICFLEILSHVRLAGVEAGEVGLVGASPAFNHMLGLIARAAPSMTPVLLLGESGTGKELAAQAVHRASNRADGPFVPVDCSGLSETLFESELFGHEKGAFTGAIASKVGLVEAAAGGTLFLD
jgi:transcriptional regulator with PAS, ATPase and Fis domain